MPRKKPVAAAEITKAVIYCRVSTQEQARDGVSLDAQEAACREYCRVRGIRVLRAHRDEGISGKTWDNQRPGLAATIADSRAQPGIAVVVYSLSRLGRSQRMIWTLLDDSGDFRLRVSSVTEPFDTTTAMGRAFLGMLAVWCQLQADMTSENTKAALAYARQNGIKLGRPSMLEVVDEEGNRTIDPEMVEILRRIRHMSISGLSIRAITAQLNDEGVRSAGGKRWHTQTVHAALKVAARL